MYIKTWSGIYLYVFYYIEHNKVHLNKNDERQEYIKNMVEKHMKEVIKKHRLEAMYFRNQDNTWIITLFSNVFKNESRKYTIKRFCQFTFGIEDTTELEDEMLSICKKRFRIMNEELELIGESNTRYDQSKFDLENAKKFEVEKEVKFSKMFDIKLLYNFISQDGRINIMTKDEEAKWINNFNIFKQDVNILNTKYGYKLEKIYNKREAKEYLALLKETLSSLNIHNRKIWDVIKKEKEQYIKLLEKTQTPITKYQLLIDNKDVHFFSYELSIENALESAESLSKIESAFYEKYKDKIRELIKKSNGNELLEEKVKDYCKLELYELFVFYKFEVDKERKETEATILKECFEKIYGVAYKDIKDLLYSPLFKLNLLTYLKFKGFVVIELASDKEIEFVKLLSNWKCNYSHCLDVVEELNEYCEKKYSENGIEFDKFKFDILKIENVEKTERVDYILSGSQIFNN